MELLAIIGVALVCLWLFKGGSSRSDRTSTPSDSLPAPSGGFEERPSSLATHDDATASHRPQDHKPIVLPKLGLGVAARRNIALAGRYVVLDFETTGLSPSLGARVIEVSARELVCGRIQRELTTLVNPGCHVPADIEHLTGISTRMLMDAPRPETVLLSLLEFIGTSPIVGHNVSFDMKFLANEAALAGRKHASESICTLLLSRRMIPECSSYRLSELATTLGLQTSQKFHRAGADTLVTAELFIEICARIQDNYGVSPLHPAILTKLQKVPKKKVTSYLSERATITS